MKKIILLICLLLLTSCANNPVNIGSYVEYEKIPIEYSLDRAKADGLVVFENGNITSGQEAWDKFIDLTNDKKPSMVRLAFYTIPEISAGEGYERQYLIQDIIFDGNKYNIYYISCEKEYNEQYNYLVRFDIDSNPLPPYYYKGVFYYLVNDKDITYEEIWSQYINPSINHVDWIQVYSKKM